MLYKIYADHSREAVRFCMPALEPITAIAARITMVQYVSSPTTFYYFHLANDCLENWKHLGYIKSPNVFDVKISDIVSVPPLNLRLLCIERVNYWKPIFVEFTGVI